MLRRQQIAVDSHSPALIPSKLYVAIKAVYQRGQFWAEEEDVDTAVFRYLVQNARHIRLQHAVFEITEQVAIDIDSGATLLEPGHV
jgi:hypothetical protein